MTATIAKNGAGIGTLKASKAAEVLIMPDEEIIQLHCELIGVTALLVGRFGDLAVQAIENLQRGDDEAVASGKKKRLAREPEAEFEDKRYRLPDGGDGFPSLSLKLSMIHAGQRKMNLVGTKLKMAFNVMPPDGMGSLIPILSEPPTMRTDRALVGGMNKSTTVTYRPSYFPWRMEPIIEFDATMISRETVLNLLSTAGRGVGLGEWRVDKDGDFGRFRIGAVKEYR